MKKQVVATVMMLSLAIVMTGCNSGVSSNTVSPDTQITQVEITDRTSYKDVIELELGDTLTLDKILKVKDENMTYDFADKTYEAAGTYDEVIKYDNWELKFKVVVSDKTAPVIEGTHDIEVVEGSEVNLLEGVSTNEGELTVSDYDARDRKSVV